MTAPTILPRQEAIEQGAPRYFTGRPCKNGHLSERYTMSAVCIECQFDYMRDFRAKVRAKRVPAQE